MSGKKKMYRMPVCFCMCILVMAVFSSCSISMNRRQGSVTASPSSDVQTMQGIVIKNDTEKSQLQIRDMDSDIISTLTYGATSVITDRYKTEQDGSRVPVGQILKATYRTSDAKLVTAEVPEEVWEYQDVTKFSFVADDNMLKVAGKKYQYSDITYCSSSGNEVEPMEFNNHDILTIRGVGIKVYSVVRTSGHGYIRLTNYEDFVGGMAEVSKNIIVPISENMLITAGEGTYRLTLCKKGAAVTKTVTVQNDKETVVDFSDYVATGRSIGEVTFAIEPDGADLYINNTAVNYDKPISLQYGKYNVTVSLTGYETYTGVLDVEEASKTINIDLIEEVATASDDSSATATPSSSSASDSNDSDSETVTKQIDSDHTITVSAPEGAEVYLDNVYKGLAPCTFTKVIGSQTITLRETGYVTKSYSVDIIDDDKNAKLSFADLVKEEAD